MTNRTDVEGVRLYIETGEERAALDFIEAASRIKVRECCAHCKREVAKTVSGVCQQCAARMGVEWVFICTCGNMERGNASRISVPCSRCKGVAV